MADVNKAREYAKTVANYIVDGDEIDRDAAAAAHIMLHMTPEEMAAELVRMGDTEKAAYERGRADENEACARICGELNPLRSEQEHHIAAVLAQRIRARLASSAEETGND